MIQLIIFSLRIIFSGIILPFRIWQFSKEKLLSKAGHHSVKSLLDKDYIVTSWLDWLIDAIIFLFYPIGIIIVLIGVVSGTFIIHRFNFLTVLIVIPLYFYH